MFWHMTQSPYPKQEVNKSAAQDAHATNIAARQPQMHELKRELFDKLALPASLSFFVSASSSVCAKILAQGEDSILLEDSDEDALDGSITSIPFTMPDIVPAFSEPADEAEGFRSPG